MSEDTRKQLRTQGKYSDKGIRSDDKGRKSFEKKHKISPLAKEEDKRKKKDRQRNSNGDKSSSTSLTEEKEFSPKYEENSDYTFSQLETPKKPVEIMGFGEHVLSVTENGESKIFYEPSFLELDEAFEYWTRIMETVEWDTQNIVIRGKEYPQPRLVSWFGPFPYSYSGVTLEPAEMPDPVKEVKILVEEYLALKNINVNFNSVLLNLYRDGKDSVSWHSDDELTLGFSPTIASVSLGEVRRFEMRRKVKYGDDNSFGDVDKHFINLTDGSLLVMTGCMQDDWQHRIPKEYHDKCSRINLTFRTVYPLEKVPDHASVRAFKKSTKTECNTSNPPKFNFKMDDENFPPLSSDASSVNVNTRCKSCETTKCHISAVKTVDDSNSEISEAESDESAGTSKSSCSKNDCQQKDIKRKNSRKSVKILLKFSVDSVQTDAEKILNSKEGHKNCSNISADSPENNVQKNSSTNHNSSEANRKKSSEYNFEDKLYADRRDEDIFRREDDKNHPVRRNGSNSGEDGWKNIQENDFEDRHYPARRRNDRRHPVRRQNISANSFMNGSDNDETNIKESEENDFTGNRHEVRRRENDFLDNRRAVRRQEEADFVDKRDRARLKKEAAYVRRHAARWQRESDLVEDRWRHDDRHSQTFQNADIDADINDVDENNLDKDDPPKRWPYREDYSILNVNAEEFVPVNVPREVNQYSEFELKNLTNYKIHFMESEALKDLSFALKKKVIEKLDEFPISDRDELEFLCQLTDGTQTDKNQILISTRICNIVDLYYGLIERREGLQNTERFLDRHSRQPGSRNQTHYSDGGRRQQNRRRNNNHRI